MTMRLLLVISMVTSMALLQPGCSFTHRMWPQKDITQDEINEPHLGKSILIASRRSDFKDALISRIGQAFREESVYVKSVGLEHLPEEDADRYTAVVMINTCMFWESDALVEAFLDRFPDRDNMIVITTSGDGDWLPDPEGREYDALTSASKMSELDDLSREIVMKLHMLLGEE